MSLLELPADSEKSGLWLGGVSSLVPLRRSARAMLMMPPAAMVRPPLCVLEMARPGVAAWLPDSMPVGRVNWATP